MTTRSEDGMVLRLINLHEYMTTMLQHPDFSNQPLTSRVRPSRLSRYTKAIGKIIERDAFTLIKSLEDNTIDLIVTRP